MFDNSIDKGYITVVLKKEGNEHELCKIGFGRNPGEESFYVDYENGTIFIDFSDGRKIIGTYETTPGPYGAKVFDYPSNRIIGRVGGELINFIRRDVDPDAGIYLPEEECLAWYTQAGRITPVNDLLSEWGIINGSEIGGAAAFIALFFNYKFNSIFRDFFTMDDGSFKEKYASYFKSPY